MLFNRVHQLSFDAHVGPMFYWYADADLPRLVLPITNISFYYWQLIVSATIIKTSSPELQFQFVPKKVNQRKSSRNLSVFFSIVCRIQKIKEFRLYKQTKITCALEICLW